MCVSFEDDMSQYLQLPYFNWCGAGGEEREKKKERKQLR